MFSRISTGSKLVALIAVGASLGAESVWAQEIAKPQITSQKFDDWYLRCSGESPKQACEVAQVAQVPKDGKSVNVLTLAVSPATDGGAKEKKSPTGLVLTALLPLNVFLPAGFVIRSKDKAVAALEYRNCNEAGCWARLPLEPRTLALLGKADSAEGDVRLMDGQNVNIRFSLKGLKPALETLQSKSSK
jgi:invasion protein IalB